MTAGDNSWVHTNTSTTMVSDGLLTTLYRKIAFEADLQYHKPFCTVITAVDDICAQCHSFGKCTVDIHLYSRCLQMYTSRSAARNTWADSADFAKHSCVLRLFCLKATPIYPCASGMLSPCGLTVQEGEFITRSRSELQTSLTLSSDIFHVCTHSRCSTCSGRMLQLAWPYALGG